MWANNRPLNQNGLGEENEGGWRMEECGKGCWKKEGERHKVAVGVGSGMCHPHIPTALLLINFSHDQLWSQIHKTWAGGPNACTPYHPRCHSTPFPCNVEMSIAFLICLLLPLWPLLYAFDEGLPKNVSFFYPCFSCFGRQRGGIKLYVCIVTLTLSLLFSCRISLKDPEQFFF